MSAWYLFSALGFYPVDPISGNYVVGTPFFDNVKIDFPNAKTPLVISSKGAPKNPYVKSLSIGGKNVRDPIIKHEQIAQGGTITFEMSSQPESWASSSMLVSESGAPPGTEQHGLKHDEL